MSKFKSSKLYGESLLGGHHEVARYQERWGMTIEGYLNWFFSEKSIVQSVSWRGTPTRKVITDLWMYQEILTRCRPDVIVEIGCFYGGSSLYLADLCELMQHGRVISIDLSHENFKASHPRVHKITGNSSDMATVEALLPLIDGKQVMVIHDGSHEYGQVLKDLTIYGKFVSSGQYLIVEDGIVDLFADSPKSYGRKWRKKYPSGGPLKSIDDFLRSNQVNFSIDENCERFLLTNSPRGYLLRH